MKRAISWIYLPPALEARASDCETTAEWQSLGTLRLQMADTGTASVAPMSAELYAAKFTQAAEEEKKNHSKGLPAFPGSTLPPQAQENAMAAIRVLQDPHVAQLLDRAASGNLTVTELDYDSSYTPSILLPLVQEWFKYAVATADSWRLHKIAQLIKAICTRSRGATGGIWDLLGGILLGQQSYAGEWWYINDKALPTELKMPFNLAKPSTTTDEKPIALTQ